MMLQLRQDFDGIFGDDFKRETAVQAQFRRVDQFDQVRGQECGRSNPQLVVIAIFCLLSIVNPLVERLNTYLRTFHERTPRASDQSAFMSSCK